METYRDTHSDGQKDIHTYTIRETFRRTEGRHTETHIQTDRRIYIHIQLEKHSGGQKGDIQRHTLCLSVSVCLSVCLSLHVSVSLYLSLQSTTISLNSSASASVPTPPSYISYTSLSRFQLCADTTRLAAAFLIECKITHKPSNSYFFPLV